MILFKDDHHRPAYDALDFRVKIFAEMFEAACSEKGGHATVTDVNTPGVHMEGSPHYDGRAVDFRLDPFTLEEAEAWAQKINSRFSRSDGKLIAITGKLDPLGKHNDHVHIQVPRPKHSWGTIRV